MVYGCVELGLKSAIQTQTGQICCFFLLRIRLSRALLYFKASCAKSRRRRKLKIALRIVHDLCQRRPIERRWSRWQAIVREANVRDAFFAWAQVGRRERRIRIAARVLRANKETTTVVGMWNTWRRVAGASKLARLLVAWGVIGPVRRALEVMQAKAKKARAEQWLRVQLLRRGLHCGFTAPMENRRQMRAVASRAQEHDRKRVTRQGLNTFCRNTAAEAPWSRKKEERVAKDCRKRMLRKGFGRWMLRHRSNLLMAVIQRRLETFRRSASIKEWARKTALSRATRTLESRRKRHDLATCMGRFEENALHRRANHQSLAAATAKWRHSRLGHGFTGWCSRGRALKRQWRSRSGASEFDRLRSIRRGLACVVAFTEQQTRARGVIREKNMSRQAGAIARWREVVRDFRANREATSSNQVRGFSLAIFRWRLGVSRLQGQRDLRRAADLLFRRWSLAVSLTLWRRRFDRASGVEAIVQRFQRQRKLGLALSGLRRWSQKRGMSRLVTWRAQVWAGAFCAKCALRNWRKHVESTGDLEASFRIAESRRLKSETARRRCFSPLAKHVFGALRCHARARQLKRRLLKAWLDHTRTLARASKQVQSFRVRSGLRRLRSWAKLAKHLRHRRLLALTHSNRRVTQFIWTAWKNTVFPLGLRVQWSPSLCTHGGGGAGQDEGIRLRLPTRKPTRKSPTSRENDGAASEVVECLGLNELTNEQQDGRTSLKHDSLVLLRLPMVGQRMRRVLHAWRKLAKKGKRLNYIRDMLPQKMGHVCPGPSHLLFTPTNSVFRNLDCGKRANSKQTVLRLALEKEKRLGCPAIPENTSKVDLEALRRIGCGQGSDTARSSGPVSHGRRNEGGRCRVNRTDFLVDTATGGSGKLSGGSYLRQYLLRSSDKTAPPVNA